MAAMTIKPDAWLGERLGRPAAHLLLGPEPVGPDAANEALGPYRRLPDAFVDASVDAARADGILACARAGLVLADTNLRLTRDSGLVFPERPGLAIRQARPGDRAAVEHIAATSFRLSRFHRDPVFPAGLADALKAAWAGNYFAAARGNGMAVAETGQGVAGFLLYLLKDREMIIDLVAVEAAHRGQGIGAGLVAAAGRQSGARRLVTGTQAVNVGAVRFYENLGFRLAGASHVFHFHGNWHVHRES